MIFIKTSSRYMINRRAIKRATADFLREQNMSEDTHDVNIAFIGRTKMRTISRDYKDEDVALPVLAFPFHEKNEEGRLFLGEVIMCYPQVILLAAERNKRVDVMIERLLLHGLTNLIKDIDGR